MLNTRIVRCSKLFKAKWSNVLLINTENALSTQPAVQTTQEKQEKQLKDFETLAGVTKKIKQKKPQKPPFAKNIFLGKFDRDILTYPELGKEDVQNLEPAVASVEKLMKHDQMVNSNAFTKKFRQNLSDYKAIGLQAPQLMDGRECYITESSRYLEALCSHKLRDNIIFNEQLGVQVLVKYGNDQQKKTYLHRLMKGDSLSAFCMAETELSEIPSVKTKATLSEDKKTWILNGEKVWVVNGTSADVLLVVALTDVVLKDIIKDPKLTIFIVEKDSPGISCTEVDSDGIEMANISFSNTPIPSENVIGKVNHAEEILSLVMTEFRISSAPASIGITKNILNKLTLDVLQQSNDVNLLYKTDAIRGKIGELVMNLYGMESALYLTADLLDSYENQDCLVESAILKIFCSQSCLNASLTALDLSGIPAISKSHWANKLHKEAVRHVSLHETTDSLKIMSALLGLQFAGVELNERVDKIRNPLFHAGFNLGRMWTDRRNNLDNPKLDLRLGDYLHPSLNAASLELEYCVKRFEFATEVLLIRFGSDIVNQHMDLRRLGDCIVDIYIMTACLGRASRSYCIGLQNSNYEMVIASSFCGQARDRVSYNVNKIVGGGEVTSDESYRAVAKQMFKSKGYYLPHPLARNF